MECRFHGKPDIVLSLHIKIVNRCWCFLYSSVAIYASRFKSLILVDSYCVFYHHAA